MITAVSFVSMSIGAVAASNLEEIQAYLNKGVSITLHGEKWTPKDSDGSTLYPITYNGSTYLPVRAVAEAAGLPVEWKGDTQTVALGESKTEVVSLSENEMVMKYIDVYINGTDLSAKQQFVKDYIHPEMQSIFTLGAMSVPTEADIRKSPKLVQSIDYTNEKTGKPGRMVLVQSDGNREDIFYIYEVKLGAVFSDKHSETFTAMRKLFN
jgi:hypothetical protein